ncbi:hypothetical protein SBA2_230020 [Acidobacteriia bacterium SbA2]|nr:hypothetical protein SBA2_230020 [Acidobacteriia bacterium SbA2]
MALLNIAQALQPFPHSFFVVRICARSQDGGDLFLENVDSEFIRRRVAGDLRALLYFLKQVISQFNSVAQHRLAPFSP